jgi:hypothetical protein
MNRSVSLIVAASVSLAVTTAPVLARQVESLRDLVGVRGSSAETDLTARGYKLERTIGSANLWWNKDTRTCAAVADDNGRVASIESASASDCGKGGSGNTLAGIAAGAAAVGLIAALSGHHDKSDHRDNNATYNAEYQRGYNDGMYSGHYATNDSEAYHSGFMAGETERNNRRHANSAVARSVPGVAGNACISKGEAEWGVYPGSVSVVSSRSYAPGNWEVVLATGHWRATCRVTVNGQVTDFRAN